MFKIGDFLIYSGQGICQVDDICDKTFAGMTKTYYILHPIENDKLTISAPVDNSNTIMHRIIDRPEAEKVLEAFKLEGVDWIEKSQARLQVYGNIVKTGNRLEIAKVINTLVRKKQEAEIEGKRFSVSDARLLNNIQGILFKQIALALDTSFETISKKVTSIINSNELPAHK